MRSHSYYIHGYNSQLPVGSVRQVIVVLGDSTQTPDVEQFKSLLQLIAGTAGRAPAVLTTDTGY